MEGNERTASMTEVAPGARWLECDGRVGSSQGCGSFWEKELGLSERKRRDFPAGPVAQTSTSPCAGDLV